MKNHYLVLLLLGFTFSLHAQTITINANYSGSTTSLQKTIGDIDSIGDGSKRGFIKFDLTTLPTNAIVTAATLQYYYYNGTGVSMPNGVYALSNDPVTAAASVLYNDCADNSPATAKLATVYWSSPVQTYFYNTFTSVGINYINSRIGTWVGMALTRDPGASSTYYFRGYTNTLYPPKLQLTYFVPAPCSGMPTPGTIIANKLFPCNGENVTLSLSGTTVATGLGYQWQKKAIASTTWANIIGANTSSYSFVSLSSANYRCVVSCTTLSLDSISNIVTISSSGVNMVPFTENFEANDGGWKGVNIGNGTSDWVWGSPNKLKITGSANGLNCWTTQITNNYSSKSNCALESPCLDFTNVTLPRIVFSMRYRTEADHDCVFLETSINGGASWTKVLYSAIVVNPYNSISNFGIFTPPVWCGDNETWKRYVVSLPSLSGIGTAKFRVHFQSDSLFNDEGVAFDSVSITNSFFDVNLASLVSPSNMCYGVASAPVKINITNLGLKLVAGSKIIASYQINNNAIVTDTIRLNTDKLIRDTIAYTFLTNASLLNAGTYILKTWATIANDSDRSNDTLQKVISIRNINAIPYWENFESNDGAWTPKIIKGTSNDFIWGTPTKTYISKANSGKQCWVTKYNSEYEPNADFALESPCINIANGVAPVLHFALNYKTEKNYDGCILESSVNGGSLWTKVTNIAYGIYNNSTTTGVFSPPFWSGNSNGWQHVKVPLISYLGQPNVKFRLHFSSDAYINDEGVAIDSILIIDVLNKDVGIAGIISPKGGCGMTSSTSLAVKIKNYGKALGIGTKIPLTFKLYNDSNILISTGSDTLNISSNFNYKDSLDFIFNPTLNLAKAGIYTLRCSTNLAQDSDATNDSIINYTIVSKASITNFPYYEDFELSDGNWYGEGINGKLINEWGWNYPSKTIINFTPNGRQCWMLNPFNFYANNTHNALYSPCFDFSNLPNPVIGFLLRFRIQYLDAMVLEASVNNGFSWQRVDSSNLQLTYNTFTSNAGGITPPKWSGDNLKWTTYRISLNSLGGQSNVQFRFRFLSDPGGSDEGVFIDSLVVSDSVFNDISITNIDAPFAKCNLNANEMLRIIIKNTGNTILPSTTKIPVAYRLNNGNPVNELITLSTPLIPGASMNYTFIQTADLSLLPSYNLVVYNAFLLDRNRLNDTINFSITKKTSITNYPYHEGFEMGIKDWTWTGEKNEIWKTANSLSNPNISAHSGITLCAFNAKFFSSNAISRLISPCFNFTSLKTRPTLSFFGTWDNSSPSQPDSINVFVSTNDGASWVKLAALSRYNAKALAAKWNRYDINLSAYASQPQVIIAIEAIGLQGANFAVDDISIYSSELRLTQDAYWGTINCPILGNNDWIDLRDSSNKLIAQLNPNGNNLGDVCFGVNIVNYPLRVELMQLNQNRTNNYYFPRNLWLQSSIIPNNPIALRFYYLPEEFNLSFDSIFKRTGNTIAIENFDVLNYSNSAQPDDLNVLNNDYTSGISTIIKPKDSLINNLLCFTFNADKLGEMNLVYRRFLSGINYNKDAYLFTLFPNPASRVITISYPTYSFENIPFKIFNTMGEVALEGSIKSCQTQIDISNWNPSVYLIKIGNSIRKFVKE